MTLDKQMEISAAVSQYLSQGSVVAFGGQNYSRSPMAAAREIARQGISDLIIVGCNLSLPADMLIGVGAVNCCEFGTGNVERFGITNRLRDAVENGTLQAVDYDHASMLLRFIAAGMGIPFIPAPSLSGTDLYNRLTSLPVPGCNKIPNPWHPEEEVILVSALSPDVAFVHAHAADSSGNTVILGPLGADIDIIRASQKCIVTCEQLLSTRELIAKYGEPTITHHYVTAIVEVPFGAHPTGLFGKYLNDDEHIRYYQECARDGGATFVTYLQQYIFLLKSHAEYINLVGGKKKLTSLSVSSLKQ